MVGNLTVVIPFYNGHQYLERLLGSIPQGIPVLIVDDQSEQPPFDEWGPDVRIVGMAQKGYFTGAVNRGIELCETDVLVLNQDTWFEDDRAFGLIDDLRNEGYAMIGERIRGTHPAFGSLGYIHGTFMFLRRDAISRVGQLDEVNYPLWGSTAEYQWRMARKGYAVKPLETVPGFYHERPEKERYGSSIRSLLDKMPAEDRYRFTQTPPRLSIIVPCYNYGRYLKDCINSLVGGETSLGVMPGQTMQSFEVIIVDDASTDDSRQIIEGIVNPAEGIRGYFLSRNVGTAEALNHGIRQAAGKYITFLSADDMREDFSLGALVEACEKNPHAFAYDDVWLFHRHQRIQKWRMQDYDFETLLWKNQVHAGIVFPKRAWEEVGGYPAVMRDGREDWAFNVALGIRGWCGVHVKQFGYLYRREDQNRSLTNTTARHREIFLQKIQSLFPAVYGGHRPMACCGKGGSARARASGLTKMQANGPKQSMTTRSITGGAMQPMASPTGSTGMVRLEYMGKQMAAIWDGPVTQVRYRFGVDRKVGWVDPRDAGERAKSGFLNLKDRHDNWLFRLEKGTSNGEVAVTPVGELVLAVAGANTVSATVVEQGQEVMTVVADPTEQEDAVSAMVVEDHTADITSGVPNPSDMYPSDIKRLNLTKEQWEILYRQELAGKNRKTIITFVEEKLAGAEPS